VCIAVEHAHLTAQHVNESREGINAGVPEHLTHSGRLLSPRWGSACCVWWVAS
jgi:hypothetical protein